MAYNNFVNISMVSMSRPAGMADVCHALMNISGKGREKIKDRERKELFMHERALELLFRSNTPTSFLSVCKNPLKPGWEGPTLSAVATLCLRLHLKPH